MTTTMNSVQVLQHLAELFDIQFTVAVQVVELDGLPGVLEAAEVLGQVVGRDGPAAVRVQLREGRRHVLLAEVGRAVQRGRNELVQVHAHIPVGVQLAQHLLRVHLPAGAAQAQPRRALRAQRLRHLRNEGPQLLRVQRAVAVAVHLLEDQPQVVDLGLRQLLGHHSHRQPLQPRAPHVPQEPLLQEAGAAEPARDRAALLAGQRRAEPGVAQRGLGRGPPPALLAQQPRQQVPRLGGHPVEVAGQVLGLVLHDGPEDLRVRVAHEGRVPRQQHVQDDAHAPQVALVRERARQHLRVHEVGRAHPGAHGRPQLQVLHLAEAKVDDAHGRAVLGPFEHDVLGLEVPVGHALAVAVRDHVQQRADDGRRLRLRERALPEDALEQVAARVHWGDQVQELGVLVDVAQLHHVGVVQRGHHLDLREQPAHVLHPRLEDALAGQLLARLPVPAPAHHAVGAAPQLALGDVVLVAHLAHEAREEDLLRRLGAPAAGQPLRDPAQDARPPPGRLLGRRAGGGATGGGEVLPARVPEIVVGGAGRHGGGAQWGSPWLVVVAGRTAFTTVALLLDCHLVLGLGLFLGEHSRHEETLFAFKGLGRLVTGSWRRLFFSGCLWQVPLIWLIISVIFFRLHGDLFDLQLD
mmetsp:Transcript_3114/g.5363  ORF Transcript_3114/g.5363 Transcript_3114/m.5363 type:complete len:636 (+) Transcript_3114:214-2121(+)